VTLPGFEKVFVSTSKNVPIFLEFGTIVTISSHRHIIFLGSAEPNRVSKHGRDSKPGQVLGSGFQVFQFRLGTLIDFFFDQWMGVLCPSPGRGTECMELRGANLQKKSASLQCAMNGATMCASGVKGLYFLGLI